MRITIFVPCLASRVKYKRNNNILSVCLCFFFVARLVLFLRLFSAHLLRTHIFPFYKTTTRIKYGICFSVRWKASIELFKQQLSKWMQLKEWWFSQIYILIISHIRENWIDNLLNLSIIHGQMRWIFFCSQSSHILILTNKKQREFNSKTMCMHKPKLSRTDAG